MLRKAGQTAGPIRLNFFVDTHGWPGGVIDYKKILHFFQHFFFHGERLALQLVYIYIDQFSRFHVKTAEAIKRFEQHTYYIYIYIDDTG